MKPNVNLALLVMAGTIYLVRALPLVLLRKEIRSPFIRSFLYYVPYVSLSVMTFPAILSATASFFSGLAGFCGSDPCLGRWKSVSCVDWGLYSGISGRVIVVRIDKRLKSIYNAISNLGKDIIFG